MGWTNWRLIARRNEWFDDDCDHDGPACYQLAIAGPRGGDLTIVYVGETKNEKGRMARYGRDGSHLAKIIRSHLRDGWSLHYRGQATASKKAAIAMQGRLLQRTDYSWNIQLNTWGKD